MGAIEHVQHAPKQRLRHRSAAAGSRVAGLAAFLGVLLAAGGIGAAPASAAPAVTYPDAISNLSITTDDGSAGPVQQWDAIQIRGDWSVPDGAVAGETFGMTLPAELQRLGTEPFPLLNPAGVTLASCTMAAGGGPDLVCTLTDAVNGLRDVGGELWLKAQASTATTSETVQFEVGTTIEIVDLPGDGGVIPEDDTAPTTPYKFGSASDNNPGTMVWTVGIPASYVTTGTFTVKDQLDPSLDPHHYTGNYWLIQRAVQDGVYVGDWVPADPSTYTATFATDNRSFEFTATGLPTSGYDYRLQYVTVPDSDAQVGDVFGNTADVGGTLASSTYTETSSGGGTGSGTTPSDEPTIVPAQDEPAALADTGTDVVPLIAAGGLLLLLGSALVVVRRRAARAAE